MSECGHNHDSHGHEEELKEVTVTLEEEQIEALEEMAAEYREKLGQAWDLSAMLRVAVGHFLTKMGKMT
ncbi:MAG TPA: hypothetical protein DDW94_04245 [Deltaproteobacteria bacterium]|nr:MAG: hypothetical protein A2Z79_10535 [Deltaproteobacteria bacterium GWA2_55_82]OGQ62938.1 MAG: hypothetical protein A3I81_06435 [Deltaproteobacteria bacterium RIFCSPLOWO2_02_FULL_55_12]OIJ72900.1 MAG: hypothetical protein A2V21_300670 [Deltaproteobacteria bacterium GWC2_55_46]HBG46183.1 hypothetical protein [Deltaproteobacteria bacterium]HCY11681.1 hypothetical protein [Deltaproteobacteria bacterium]